MISVKKMSMLLLALCLTASLAAPASAAGPLNYTFQGAGDPEYGKPTSFEVVYTADGGARKNEDVSKNAALAPPAFGSASADTSSQASYPSLPAGAESSLTPLLLLSPQGLKGGFAGAPFGGAAIDGTSAAVIVPGSPLESSAPDASTSVPNTDAASGFTEVTDDLYHKNGHLGTLKIPAIGLSVKIYEGTGSSALAKGVGHFEETSIWSGNVGLAGHNRGVNSYFGKLHTLKAGDTITLTTKLGEHSYEVVSVSKVSETDRSALASTAENMLTLYTCVRNERGQRWCVRAKGTV